jgi:hypothetical protein
VSESLWKKGKQGKQKLSEDPLCKENSESAATLEWLKETQSPHKQHKVEIASAVVLLHYGVIVRMV